MIMRFWIHIFVLLCVWSCATDKEAVCEDGYGMTSDGVCVEVDTPADDSASIEDPAIEGDADGECTDGADNDRDSLFDCDDPGCADDPACAEDPDIEGDAPGECTDGADNDRDELFDCDDPGCADDPACGGVDSDADADTDVDADADADADTDADADADTDADADSDADGAVETYHPPGYAGARVHGPDTNNLVEDCMPCHGDDYRGMSGAFPETEVNCDDCHEGLEEWRTNCIYCHGGEEDESGAPPREVNGEAGDPTTTYSFQAHTVHVQDSAMKSGFDCVECHTKPDDIFSVGHVIVGDATPDHSEVTFAGGLSPEASWEAGTCSDLYCHGNGQEPNGEISEDAGEQSCGDCHPYIDSSMAEWESMSGAHIDHLILPGPSCTMCHSNTMSDYECTDDASCITDVTLHLNKENDIRFPDELAPTMVYERNMCTGGSGSCHDSDHAPPPWSMTGGSDFDEPPLDDPPEPDDPPPDGPMDDPPMDDPPMDDPPMDDPPMDDPPGG